MAPKSYSYKGELRYRCDDGRLHRFPEEAAECLHDRSTKHFAFLELLPPRTRRCNNPKAPQSGKAVPKTPAGKKGARPPTASPAQGYPTPPETQQEEDMGDEIVVAMPARMEASSPIRAGRGDVPACGTQVPASEAQDDSDDAQAMMLDENPAVQDYTYGFARDASPGSSPPPAAATSPDTTHVLETVLRARSRSSTPPSNNSRPSTPENQLTNNRTADLENEVLALQASRRNLIETVKDITFTCSRLRLRLRLSNISTSLAETAGDRAKREAIAAREERDRALGLVEMKEESRRNAWMTMGMFLLLVVWYVIYRWYNDVDQKYINSRRCAMFGMSPDCW